MIHATRVIPGGPDRQIREPAVIEIANAGDRGAEVIVSAQAATKPPGAVGHLLPAINPAIHLHVQDPDSTRVVGAVIIIRGTI